MIRLAYPGAASHYSAAMGTVLANGRGNVRLRVAVVGVAEYAPASRLRSLPNSRFDALRMIDIFSRLRRTSASFEFFVAIEPEQTGWPALSQGLCRFFESGKPGEDLVLFHGGHGLHLDGRSFLASSDYVGVGREGALALSELLDAMAATRPCNRVLVLDACHAGEAPTQLGPDILSPLDGVAILSACDLDESALDVDELGGGLMSSVLTRGLAGGAGIAIDRDRAVTVAGLFAFVAREVPAWLAANRRRLRIPDAVRQTPRMTSALRGDPVLASWPWAGREAPATRRTRRPAELNFARDWMESLAVLHAVSATAARAALARNTAGDFMLDPAAHRDELERLVYHFLDDVGLDLDSAEVFVLAAVFALHDLGIGTHGASFSRFEHAARCVREQRAGQLPILLPDGLGAAVAATLEQMAGVPGAAEYEPWSGRALRVGVLGRMVRLAHRLAIAHERSADDVGGGAVGQAWVRRPLISGPIDWTPGATAVAVVASNLDADARAAVERWHCLAGVELDRLRGAANPFGPGWIDLQDRRSHVMVQA